MKKRYKKKIRYTNIIPFIICILVLGLSIGFSAFEEQMLVTDLVADIRLKQDIRVTNVTINNVSPNTVSQSLDYNKSNISDTVTLPNSDSSITYEVEITNIENSEMGIYDLTLSNSNLDYTIDNYTKKDKLCDDNNNLKCNLGSKSTLQITVFYKENMYNENNIDQTFTLDFDFRGFYTITYTDIEGNYQSSIMDGETLTVDFGENAPDKANVLINGVILTNEEFTYENGVITVSNIDNNVEIFSRIPSTYQLVEYIASNGYQYIDTKYHINPNTKVEYKAKRIGNESGEAMHFGQHDDTNGQVWIEWYADRLYYNFGTSSYGAVSFKPEMNRFYTTEISADGLYVDKTKLANITIEKSLIYDRSSYIFAVNNGTPKLPTKGLGIQYFSFSENGELKRNFLACYRKSDGVIGMYDTVNNEFYTNAGTGTFTKGNDVYTSEEAENSENYFDNFVVVDYLESNGNQFIDTGYKPNNNTKVKLTFYYENWADGQAPYGYYTGNETGPNFSSNISNVGNWRFGNQNIQAGSILNQSKYQNSIVVSDMDKNGIKFNDELIGTYASTTFQSDYSMYIFAVNQNGGKTYGYSGKIYGMKIYENEQLVRDFVPCYRKLDSKPGMYDLVNDIFYVNWGTGDFSIGIETKSFDNFVAVDYLESNGSQYIDTGYKPNNNTKVKLTFYYENWADGQAPYGYYTGSSTGPNFSSNISNVGNWRFGNQNIQAGSILNQSKYQNSIVVSDMDKNGIKFNDELIGTYASTTFQSDYSMYIFAANQNGGKTYGYSGKIYGMKIYENEELVRDFVPCYRKLDSKPGMYDLVNDVFYVNRGTGDFTLGPEVE